MTTFDYTSQTAIVTGGTRGIGGAISTAFLKAGATVIATYAGNREAAEAYAESQAERSRLHLQCFDVGDYAAWRVSTAGWTSISTGWMSW